MPPVRKVLAKGSNDLDVTKLPIPKTWPMDGGRYITLPLVTKDPNRRTQSGMYRGQVFGPKEGIALANTQHGADHAAAWPDGNAAVTVLVDPD